MPQLLVSNLSERNRVANPEPCLARGLQPLDLGAQLGEAFEPVVRRRPPKRKQIGE